MSNENLSICMSCFLATILSAASRCLVRCSCLARAPAFPARLLARFPPTSEGTPAISACSLFAANR